ncbi:hypothetical protein HK096_008231 [Nowakowskiella sp. JEL0078]|nr:hypothetical protein HK096_008231 [Nowakowskiella sp. JEL0078]
MEKDEAIRTTNDSALLSKLAIVNAGYIDDPYAKLFSKTLGRVQRKSPIFNRGSYLRVTAIDAILQKFLEFPASVDKQIVSFGAGSDTRFFSLKSANKHPLRYYEIDFPEITTKKAISIGRNKVLSSLVGSFKLLSGGTQLHGKEYHLIAADLREYGNLTDILTANNFDSNLPTLFLSECLFVYLDPHVSENIVSWASQLCPTAVFVNFDPIEPNDAFGKIMLQNLEAQNVDLRGIYEYHNLETQERRYLKSTWKRAKSISIDQLYEEYVSKDEKERIRNLEIFDEVEEWNMLARHYCLTIAVQKSDQSTDQEDNSIYKLVENGQPGLIRQQYVE